MDHSTDPHQNDHSNPDRPPVTPDHPDKPDPFDPFKTTAIADGGAVSQPETEVQFQTHLDDALQPNTPDTPPSPSPHASTSDTAPSQQDPYDGSLIQTIDELRETITTGWEYHIHELDSESTLEHAITNPHNETQYTLRRIDSSYFVYPGSERPGELETQNNPHGYGTFSTALAALIEALDWGTLPLKTPNIWTYTGYEDTTQTFPQYLSGTNNTECGSHYFANTSADYGITIESYQDPHQSNKTVSVLSISNAADPNSGTTVYRERFPGQNHAFATLLGFLDTGLSHAVYSHNSYTGPTSAIQSIQEIIQ